MGAPKLKEIEVPPHLREQFDAMPLNLLVPEAAEIMRCSVTTIRRRIEDGMLQAICGGKGSAVLIPRTEILRFMIERPAR